MPTVTFGVSTDIRGMNPLGDTDIVEMLNTTAILGNPDNFGPGNILLNATFVGASGNQQFGLWLDGTAGFNASQLNFSNWTDYDWATTTGDRFAFYQGDGANTIVGTSRSDLITFWSPFQSGLGDDDLDGGLGVDQINGGGGNDILRSLAGNTSEWRFDGGADTDTMVIDRTGATAGVTFRVSAVSTTQIDVAGSWIAENIERLNATGGSGADTFIGGALVDNLNGGDGDDTITGGGGADILDGGAGTGDTVVVDRSTATTNITYSLANQSTTLTFDDGSTGTNFERVRITTGSGADTVTGSSLADDIDGGTGLDTLNGGVGDDVLRSGLGNTREQQFDGGAGTGDVLFVDRSTATTALDFRASTHGDFQSDVGGTWNAFGIERLNVVGGSGNDIMRGGFNADDVLNGGGGDDVLEAWGGVDILDGGAGTADWVRLTFSTATAAINASFANPATLVTFANGSTAINFERVDLTTGSGDDVLVGGDLQDFFSGNGGADDIDGGLGRDSMHGGEGDDIIRSGLGNTQETGSSFSAGVTGGNGNDTMVIDRSTATANLTFTLASTNQTDIGGSWGLSQMERLQAFTGSGNDTLTGGTLNDWIGAGAGNDTVNGNAGADFLAGGEGDDTIVGGTEADILSGDAGNDTITFDFGDWYVSGGEGLDTGILSGTAGHRVDMAAFSVERFTGGGGADFIFTSGTHFMDVNGGAGADVIQGTAHGDLLRGGNDGDLILGHAGGDVVAGESGVDRLYGGAGNDILVGGAGVDSFVFKEFGAANHDTITDYAAGERIELSPLDFVGLTAGVLQASEFALAGPTAATAQIIFRIADGNGILEYDADGTGAGAAQTIAILQGVTTFSASNVFIGFTF